jgi:uncharacterized protein YbjT (DUF2867 family)
LAELQGPLDLGVLKMKIVIIGGTGLIGSNLAGKLSKLGHDVVAAAPSTGVNTITGEGLSAVLAGADVVVDVANSPSFEDEAVMSFFTVSGKNLLAAEAAAGVKHHVALSVVGTERLLASGYFRAKLAQEDLIKSASVPYTIVRATQFFEFVGAIAHSGTDGNTVTVSSALMQPMASDDVAAALAEIAVDSPRSGTVEIAGPQALPIDEFVRVYLTAKGDPRTVIGDAKVPYFGAVLDNGTLTPGTGALLGKTRFADWLSQSEAA